MVKDNAQIEGVDFIEIFSFVVNQTFIIIVLPLVACMKLKLEQLDSKREVLHGELDEDVYKD